MTNHSLAPEPVSTTLRMVRGRFSVQCSEPPPGDQTLPVLLRSGVPGPRIRPNSVRLKVRAGAATFKACHPAQLKGKNQTSSELPPGPVKHYGPAFVPSPIFRWVAHLRTCLVVGISIICC